MKTLKIKERTICKNCMDEIAGLKGIIHRQDDEIKALRNSQPPAKAVTLPTQPPAGERPSCQRCHGTGFIDGGGTAFAKHCPECNEFVEATITPQAVETVENHYQSLRRELDDLTQQIAAKDAEIAALTAKLESLRDAVKDYRDNEEVHSSVLNYREHETRVVTARLWAALQAAQAK